MAKAGAIWGVSGVVILLLFAVYRLSVIAIDAFGYQFETWHWIVLAINIIFMAYSEGYKGFQKAFSPRVVARAQTIVTAPKISRIILAPLFCMCYFDATRKRKMVTYILTLGIVVLIILFNQIPQPLRGILDIGVVVGLSWGISCILWFSAQSLRDGGLEFPADLASSE
ncbi:MAG: hypothetical protein ACI845_002956 [Gammaproteobacteria bacterium]|jgi:hypothetical protein